jgi:hypothetical protein
VGSRTGLGGRCTAQTPRSAPHRSASRRRRRRFAPSPYPASPGQPDDAHRVEERIHRFGGGGGRDSRGCRWRASARGSSRGACPSTALSALRCRQRRGSPSRIRTWAPTVRREERVLAVGSKAPQDEARVLLHLHVVRALRRGHDLLHRKDDQALCPSTRDILRCDRRTQLGEGRR